MTGGRSARAVARPHRGRGVGQELLTRWSEPHRRYHDVDHLRSVLHIVDQLAGDAVDPDAVRLAAWFHDAVYSGRPGDDERTSAELAASILLHSASKPRRSPRSFVSSS